MEIDLNSFLFTTGYTRTDYCSNQQVGIKLWKTTAARKTSRFVDLFKYAPVHSRIGSYVPAIRTWT